MAVTAACCQMSTRLNGIGGILAPVQAPQHVRNVCLHSPFLNRSLWGHVHRAEDWARWEPAKRSTPLVVCFAVQRGPRIHKGKSWKPDQKKGSGPKSKALLNKLKGLVVAEQIYEELDAWSAWDLDFPIVPLKRALAELKAAREWSLILIISRWMLSKGQGRTLGTFDMMVEAHDALGSWEDADRMWQGLLAESPAVIPRVIFSRMMHVYSAHSLHQKCIEVFEAMEDMGVRPHESMLKIVAASYRALGQPDMAEEIVRRYPPTPMEIKKRIRKPLVSSNDVDGRKEMRDDGQEVNKENAHGKEEVQTEGKVQNRPLKGGKKVRALENIIQRQAASRVPDWYARWLGTSVSVLEERVSSTYASTEPRTPGS